MKKWIKNTAVATLMLAFFTTTAQNKSSLLWEIKGNGLEKPSYLFGTIHMICEEDYVMTPVIEHTLKNVEAFYAEIDFSNQAELMIMQASLAATEPLSKRIDTATYEQLKELLNETVNIDIATFENLSDAAIVSMITFKSFPCTDYKMYEMELLQRAMTTGKKMGGLETVKQQMELMNKTMNTDVIIKMLEELKEKGFESTKKLVALYKKQDIDNMLDLMNESSYMDETVYHEMLTQRNHEWIKKMPEIMQKHSTFFAVGAGHLGGEQGVLHLLRDQGYEITPIAIH